MGLLMVGVVAPGWLVTERKLDISLFDRWKRFQYPHSFLIGIVFGFAWTPCIGPVLGVILYWASHAETAIRGMLLLLSFGVGMGVPFLIVALGFQQLAPLLQKTKRIGHILNIIAGIIIIIMGILLFTNTIQIVSMWLIRQLGLIELTV
jgi:cytochrome c-type biogenesis protein